MLRAFALVIATCILVGTAGAQPLQAGQVFQLRMVQQTATKRSNGDGGTSYDRDTLIETVLSVRANGVELQYALPKETTSDERASDWKFPVRVFKPASGPLQLLNRAEMEERLEKWLKDAHWTRQVCGHWIFTWNAFQIDCDPDGAIKIIEAFDLRSAEVREGASYKEAGALAGAIARKSTGPNGAVFSVEMPIDPDAVRRSEAESDVVAGEIMQKPVTFGTAFAERSKENVTGTVSVTFEADANGNVTRRTRLSKIEIKQPNGQSEMRTVTQTLERRLLSEH